MASQVRSHPSRATWISPQWLDKKNPIIYTLERSIRGRSEIKFGTKALWVLALTAFLAKPLYTLAPDSKSRKNRISLHTGLFSTSIRDELGSPLTYKGSGIPLYLSYRFAGSRNRHTAALLYSRNQLTPNRYFSVGSHNMQHSRFSFSYGYHHFLMPVFKNRGKVFLGVIWDTHISLRELGYIWNFSNSFGDRISSLDASFFLETRLGRNYRLSFQLDFPLLAVMGRTSYNQRDVETEVVTFNRFLRLKNSFSLERILSPRFNVRFEYRFYYYRYPEPFPVYSAGDHYLVGLTIKL